MQNCQPSGDTFSSLGGIDAMPLSVWMVDNKYGHSLTYDLTDIHVLGPRRNASLAGTHRFRLASRHKLMLS